MAKTNKHLSFPCGGVKMRFSILALLRHYTNCPRSATVKEIRDLQFLSVHGCPASGLENLAQIGAKISYCRTAISFLGRASRVATIVADRKQCPRICPRLGAKKPSIIAKPTRTRNHLSPKFGLLPLLNTSH